MVLLTSEPLDPAPLRAAVSRPGAGAVLIFEGTTRDTFGGRRVLRLEYEAYAPLARAELRRILDELEAEHPELRLAVAHRLGPVPVGEVSVLVACSAPHRDLAYLGSRAAIDRLKARVPIFKKEHYDDQSAEWRANAESPPGDL